MTLKEQIARILQPGAFDHSGIQFFELRDIALNKAEDVLRLIALAREGEGKEDGLSPKPQEVTLTKEEALQESSYLAGMKAGWNFGVVEDNEGYQRAQASRAGYLRPIIEDRRRRKAADAHNPRDTQS